MKKYYYSSDGKSKEGPYDIHELINHKITQDTLIWHLDLDNWVKADTLEELSHIIIKKEPIPPSLPEPKEKPKDDIPKEPVLPQPPLSPPSRPIAAPPKTWLVESILVTFLCCLPIGIAAIVNAAKVESRYLIGDIDAAQHHSEQAGKWVKLSLGLGLLVFIITFFMGVFLE